MLQHSLAVCLPILVETVCLLQILGNKSLKIKYLSPSTVFVATGAPQGQLTEDLDTSSLALTIHIVDTVTGAPIFSQIHKVSPASKLGLVTNTQIWRVSQP